MHLEIRGFKRSSFVALTAVFASFNVVCDSLVGLPQLSSGVWYSWIFVAEPITGAVLGPYAGFLSSLIGALIGHFVYFRGFEEFLFTLGAPLGAMISGFLFRGEWRAVLIYYLVLFGAYFATPVAWQLPWWGMWDIYVALGLLVFVTGSMKTRKGFWNTESSGLFHVLAFSAFIGLEADVLFRIFVLIPCQTYWLFYGWNVKVLRSVWMLGAAETPVKAALSTLVTVMVTPPILRVLRKAGIRIAED